MLFRTIRVDTVNYTGENNLKSKLKINQMIWGMFGERKILALGDTHAMEGP